MSPSPVLCRSPGLLGLDVFGTGPARMRRPDLDKSSLSLTLAFLSFLLRCADGSMMNGLQAVDVWKARFNNPQGGTKGLLNAVQVRPLSASFRPRLKTQLTSSTYGSAEHRRSDRSPVLRARQRQARSTCWYPPRIHHQYVLPPFFIDPS